jgi:hypothetical protein
MLAVSVIADIAELAATHAPVYRNHLAFRQFHAFVEALRNELDLALTPATPQLYERTRRCERE